MVHEVQKSNKAILLLIDKLNRSSVSPIERQLLEKLSVCRDEKTGHSWPSLFYLSAKTLWDQKTIQRNLRALQRKKILAIQRRGSHKSNIYIINDSALVLLICAQKENQPTMPDPPESPLKTGLSAVSENEHIDTQSPFQSGLSVLLDPPESPPSIKDNINNNINNTDQDKIERFIVNSAREEVVPKKPEQFFYNIKPDHEIVWDNIRTNRTLAWFELPVGLKHEQIDRKIHRIVNVFKVNGLFYIVKHGYDPRRIHAETHMRIEYEEN